MSTPKRQGKGVRTLEDIRLRCRIDEETKCWHWSMAISDGGKKRSSRTPRVSVYESVVDSNASDDRRVTVSVGRVAWVQSGRKLPCGWVVWRTCPNDDCCAPHHLKAGTKAEEGAWMAASGRRRGDPRRAAINLRNVAAAQAVSLETVRAIEVQIAEGRMQRDISAEFGVHVATISKISTGKHLHQRGGVRGASIFNLVSA